MAWFWGVLILFLVFLVLAIAEWSIDIENISRREAYQGVLSDLGFFLLIGLAMALLLQLFGMEYGLIIFQIVCVVGISSWLLSWHFRKQKAGGLLLNIGKTKETEALFTAGLVLTVFAIPLIWQFIEHILRGFSQSTSLIKEALNVIFFLFIPISIMARGLSKIEIRANGICSMLHFHTWQSIRSYNWKESEASTLKIRFISKFFGLQRLMILTVPLKHREAVSHILDERLPNKCL